MITLCISERWYLEGLCRIEQFSSLKALNEFRRQLDPGVTSWVLGEPRPKSKERGWVW